jgi:Mn-dependent DtxR family transcriptional regulator
LGLFRGKAKRLAFGTKIWYDEKNSKKEVTSLALQESGEMYLETIYVLSKIHPHVRSIDISDHMGYSKPSVSRAVGILKTGGYILVDKDGFITLTDAGRKVAEKIFSRHTLISNLLIRLGVDPKVAAEDACKIEHAISDESIEAIRRHVEIYGS